MANAITPINGNPRIIPSRDAAMSIERFVARENETCESRRTGTASSAPGSSAGFSRHLLVYAMRVLDLHSENFNCRSCSTACNLAVRSGTGSPADPFSFTISLTWFTEPMMEGLQGISRCSPPSHREPTTLRLSSGRTMSSRTRVIPAVQCQQRALAPDLSYFVSKFVS